MWTHIDLPRAKRFESSDSDGSLRAVIFNSYDYIVQPAAGGARPRFELTVRLRPLESDGERMMKWTESYEDEYAASCSVVRIIGAMPEADS